MLAINAYTQDLGIYPLKPVECNLVRGDLRRSYGGPGYWEESQDHIFTAQKVAEAYFCPILIFQAKIGGILSNA